MKGRPARDITISREWMVLLYPSFGHLTEKCMRGPHIKDNIFSGLGFVCPATYLTLVRQRDEMK